MNEALFAIWFFLPAGLANMTPVLTAQIKQLDFLDKPIDFGWSLGKHRIFGDNKTIRGLVTGYLATLVLVLLQIWLYNNWSFVKEYSLLDYNTTNPLIMTAVFTFGALGGDALESFFKRRVGVKPGESWFPFDQLDWIFGAILLSMLVVDLPVAVYAWAVVWALIFHPFSTFIGWLFGLKDKPI